MNACRLALVLRRALGQAAGPIRWQLSVQYDALELPRELGLLFLVLGPHLLPRLLFLCALLRIALEDIVDARWHLELAVLPAELLAGCLGLLLSEGSAVRIMAIRLVRGAEANNGLHLDERRLVSARLRLGDGLADGVHIRVAVRDGEHLPAVGLVALAHILGEGELGVTVNGDAVVVVKGDELPKAQVACVGARLMGDALLHATVTHDAIGVVVDEGHVGLIVDGCEVRLCSCEAHSVRDAHAERSRGHLDPRGLKVLWVPRRLRAPLPELLDVVDGDARITGEVEQGVLEHAAVAGGQHEAIAVGPVGICRVEVHLLREEDVADRRLAHGCAGVTAVGLVDGIDGQEADRIDAIRVDLCAHRGGDDAGAPALGLAGGSRSCGRQDEASRAHCNARGRREHRLGLRALVQLDGGRGLGRGTEDGAHETADRGPSDHDQHTRRAQGKEQGALAAAEFRLREARHLRTSLQRSAYWPPTKPNQSPTP
mmetsp:Transcript_16667/g.36754  ORF Transcript_16667/g.36754 Transcript_16667/m.36754 type:complete len:486 (-) Transcript_16667:8-1465(-)